MHRVASTASGWTSTPSPRPSSAASCGRRATSRSRSGRSIRRTIPTPTPSCSCPARSSSASARARSTSATIATGGSTCPGAFWRPRRPGTTSTAATAIPSSTSLEDVEAVRGLGGQGAADRGGVGVRRPGRPRRRRLRLGRRVHFPAASRWRTPGRASSPGRTSSSTASRARRRSALPAERLRARRHGRQRLGVDDGLFTADPTRSRARAACRATRGSPRRERADPASDPAPRDQGRVAPLRAELLPPLPAAARRPRRSTRDGPPRLPLHRPLRRQRRRRSRQSSRAPERPRPRSARA